MWKRFQSHGREKDKQIGNPVLVETTYDEDQLRNTPHVTDFASHQPDTYLGYAPQSSNSLAPQDPRDYRASEVPTVSSIYSQPSPELKTRYKPTTTSPSSYEDISPPSSPEADHQQQSDASHPRRFRSMRDVSPVDENRGQHAGPPLPGSNIPVLRKVHPSVRDKLSTGTQKFWGGKVEPNAKVRWDEYSGEPTSGDAGKAGQVSPGTYAKGSPTPSPSGPQPLGNHVSVTGPQESSRDNSRNPSGVSERNNRFGTRPSPVDTTTKPVEPWSRASGRTEIVQPFKDQPSQQPLKFQRKADGRNVPGPGKGAATSLAGDVTRTPVPADTAAVADDPKKLGLHEDPIKPVVPLKVGRNSPPRTVASPTSPHVQTYQAAYSYPSPVTPTNKPSTLAGDSSAQPYSTPLNTKIGRDSVESTPDSTIGKDHGPTSRFSWTTYNTSTTYQRSPPPSPPPPMPTSRVPTEPISAASSILNRRRPVPTSDKLPARKPVPSTARTMITGPPSPRAESTFSTNTQKALPRPPTELTAADHIEILESQMEDLRVRRTNVHRLLQDLNNMAPPNPLITDFKKMRLVEQRKKEFEDALAEIKREEHDVGLRLHRAWRKREKDDPNGSESSLWVRRVTR
ncbi:hypothetical protein BDV95DRAFT_493353 [Massariosphaeria phaeospora]|uniref:Uncharacterized protein n=1 Tax=Massariosphaeria phaeospora TaxID=100035 RepID=A0A7C8I6X4_9PLEO|nr:hypothetical protein BDV95DRAFT_493353 [Massariosphaeria phaeospora]